MATSTTTCYLAGTFTNAYLTANGAKFNVGTGKDITVGQGARGRHLGNGNPGKSGDGRLILSGANNQGPGATNINGGLIQITSAAGLGTTDGNTVVASGTELVVNTTGLNVAEPSSTSCTSD